MFAPQRGSNMNSSGSQSFRTVKQLDRWLKHHHASAQELWVHIFRKHSGIPSVSWDDCVLAALAWGWIDGQRKSLDEVSFLQRLTPRQPRSNWSKRNCEHAERLILEGRMQPAGLAQVEAARNDGRWTRAYSGGSEMVLPADFLEALDKCSEAKQFFATLDRRNVFAIYYRLQIARREVTRKRLIANAVAQLARREPFHGGDKDHRAPFMIRD
jgi:uncharacterized protein YdeI (YjbR/CyaY-like superfamily)